MILLLFQTALQVLSTVGSSVRGTGLRLLCEASGGSVVHVRAGEPKFGDEALRALVKAAPQLTRVTLEVRGGVLMSCAVLCCVVSCKGAECCASGLLLL